MCNFKLTTVLWMARPVTFESESLTDTDSDKMTDDSDGRAFTIRYKTRDGVAVLCEQGAHRGDERRADERCRGGGSRAVARGSGRARAADEDGDQECRDGDGARARGFGKRHGSAAPRARAGGRGREA